MIHRETEALDKTREKALYRHLVAVRRNDPFSPNECRSANRFMTTTVSFDCGRPTLTHRFVGIGRPEMRSAMRDLGAQ